MLASIFPVILFIILSLCSALLQPPHVVFFGDLVPCENTGADQPGFKISCCKSVWRFAEPFESNDPISSYAVDKSNDAWQDLYTKPSDQERAVVDIDPEKTSLVMSCSERL